MPWIQPVFWLRLYLGGKTGDLGCLARISPAAGSVLGSHARPTSGLCRAGAGARCGSQKPLPIPGLQITLQTLCRPRLAPRNGDRAKCRDPMFPKPQRGEARQTLELLWDKTQLFNPGTAPGEPPPRALKLLQWTGSRAADSSTPKQGIPQENQFSSIAAVVGTEMNRSRNQLH